MRGLMFMVLLASCFLVLAACGGSSVDKGSGQGGCSDPDFTYRGGKEDTSGGQKGKGGSGDGSAGGSKDSGSGKDGSSGKGQGDISAKDKPKAEPEPGPIDWNNFTPVARTNITGKETPFPHVMALWDEAYRSVRIVLSVDPVPADMLARLRSGEPLPDPAVHYIINLNMDEGVTKFSPKDVATWSYDFYNLTDLSPMKLINIGKPTIKELQGEAKVGTKVRVRIQFESEKVKGAPEEKVHFDVVQELELK